MYSGGLASSKARCEARMMLYHYHSMTGAMLWLRYGLWRGQSMRQCVCERLESPGTKTFTIDEVRSMLAGFRGQAFRASVQPWEIYCSTRLRRDFEAVSIAGFGKCFHARWFADSESGGACFF